MKAFIVNSKDLLDKKKNPHFSLSPREIEKNPAIKRKYLACVWCGNRMPKDRPYAKYCRNKCKKEALGQK